MAHKTNFKDHLPLGWCKTVAHITRKIFDDNITFEELQLIFQTDKENEAKNILTEKYREAITYLLQSHNVTKFSEDDLGYIHLLEDIDCIINIFAWEKNKQVFKIDNAFLDELLETENVMITKDVFKHLPYSSFYVDLSDCQDICKKIDGEGFFVYVEEVIDNSEKKWCFHLCKIDENNNYDEILAFDNKEHFISNDYFKIKENVNVYDYTKSMSHYVNSKEVETGLFRKVVIQILLYLSSVEPDIEESNMTKESYRAPNPNFRPKNKFSEIKAWDVGVKFGSAFRKWIEKKDSETVTAVPTGTGSRKRPHCRRAHYHYFWYGKKDGTSERVKRQKWISEMFINSDTDSDDVPVTIHKTD